MAKSTRFFLVGLVVSLIVYGFGIVCSKFEESKINLLVKQCVKESHGSERPDLEWLNSYVMVCEPQDLVRRSELIGIQKDIVGLYLGKNWVVYVCGNLALVILVVFSMPYSWYFLLRRMIEIRKAVLGR